MNPFHNFAMILKADAPTRSQAGKQDEP